eukprot:scaffold4530_cov146-Skeletonema_menzelii.AAC.18
MYCCIRRVWFVVAVAHDCGCGWRLVSWTGNDGYGRRVHSRKAFSNNGGYLLSEHIISVRGKLFAVPPEKSLES